MRTGPGDVYGVSGAHRPWSGEASELKGNSHDPRHRVEAQETIDVCLNCELTRCMHGSEECPLRKMRRKPKKTKTGADCKTNAKPRSPENQALMDRIYTMVIYGGRDSWIARELGISRGKLGYWKRMLVKEGRL